MDKESISVRLYYPYDADLIALMEMPGFSLPYVTKQAVSYYAHGKKLVIETPKAVKYIPQNTEHISYAYHFLLDKEEDKQVINFLKTIKIGLRCSFIKALVRSCLDTLHMEYYIDNDGNCAKDVFDFMNKIRDNKNVYVCPVQKKTFATGDYGVLQQDDIYNEDFETEELDLSYLEKKEVRPVMNREEAQKAVKESNETLFKSSQERRAEREKKAQDAINRLLNLSHNEEEAEVEKKDPVDAFFDDEF